MAFGQMALAGTPADSAVANQLITLIENGPLDSALVEARYLINQHCAKNYDCQKQTYGIIRNYFEENFDLEPSIKLSLLQISVAKKSKKAAWQAKMHADAYRYFEALRLYNEAIQHIDTAIEIYTALKNTGGLLDAKQSKARIVGQLQSNDKAIAMLKELLPMAEAQKNKNHWLIIQDELISLYLKEPKNWAKAEKPLITQRHYFLTKPKSKDRIAPLLQMVYLRYYTLRMNQGDTASAELYLDTALALTAQVTDNYRVSYFNLLKAEFLVYQNNGKEAKPYINKAIAVSKKYNIYDLLSRAAKLQERIALKQGNYSQAYLHLRDNIRFDSILNKRTEGFNLKNHYLKLEKKQIEKARQQEAQASKITRLRYELMLAVVGFVLFLMAILGWSLHKKRKHAHALSIKNDLITEQSNALKKADLQKAKFYANVSHELRTPLTLILSPLRRIAQSENFDRKEQQLLNTLSKGVTQLQRLVNQLLDFGKLQNDTLQISLDPTPVASFFKSYLAQFESLAQQKEISYNYELAINDRLHLGLDREKCRQILFNLLSNAFKFTPRGEEVAVSISWENSTLSLAVKDSGMGISTEDQAKIFERYFQSTDAKKNLIGGTGIGLALCEEYAQLMGGRISVKSAPNKGAHFKIEIPANKAIATHQSYVPSATITPSTRAVADEVGNSQRILVVEDNQDLQSYIYSILAQSYQVTTADNGQEALALLEKTPVDLVLSDLMMPVMDGQALLENLKAKPSSQHLPIIMLTARPEAATKLKALRFGVDDYMTKPFNDEELLARVGNLLERKNIRQSETLNAEKKREEKEPNKLAGLAAEDQAWLTSFEKYLRAHLIDESLKVATLAEAFSMSESSLYRRLKALVGLSPKQYLDELRLDHARAKLEAGEVKTIKELAALCGYDEPRTFSRSYYKRFGKNPSDY
jgi:signal transduction histidine kinase/DNA-binding response OmpR family regulator